MVVFENSITYISHRLTTAITAVYVLLRLVVFNLMFIITVGFEKYSLLIFRCTETFTRNRKPSRIEIGFIQVKE